MLLFSGRHLDAHEDKGYIMRYDLDAEHFNAGWDAAAFEYAKPAPLTHS